MRKILLWSAVLPLLFISACGKGSKSQIVTLNDLEFSFEGPLYEGPNTAQYAWKVNLKELLKDQYQEGMKIKGAKILAAEVKETECVSDSNSEESAGCYGFEQIKSLVLSFASNNKAISMQESALLNPIDATKKSQTLNVSGEADLTAFLNESDVYIVLDADISEDIDDNFALRTNITLELSFD
jgi:hypothetical protein